ncbi:FAD-binding oxidoreductase [Prauserella endophytica]|uniref:FAD-binding oxidoreductase n=1 Tax=Prauserella endophytica TaxID=1592324 RepID=A0ABY2S457_9PSEU|nr:FAD-binding oxidoreductase [Prauserella endophytica]TKG70502.1 FAD-binding oxidoreductase [Prauserella endophytica]
MTASATHLEDLAHHLRGPLHLPDDEGGEGGEGYADARSGFQLGLTHRPAAIVEALDTADVRAVVRYATANGLGVAVQATGHGLVAPATEDAVLISTRRMDTVRVDPAERTVWLGAGVRWRRVLDAAGEHGLAPLSGSSPDVGAVSYTLGGGLGPLARRYGYAADHVRRVELVTADGEVREVSAEEDPDLFWALRGGGGNFGVVTGLELGLVPVARLYGGGLLFDGTHAGEVLEAYRNWTATVPDELTSSVGMVPVPDAPEVPEPLRGKYLVHVRIAHLGGVSEGEALVAPLRAVAPRLRDDLGELPYSASPSIYNDPADPHSYLGDNAFVHGLDAAALRAIVDLAGPDSPVPCVVDLRHLGGALRQGGVDSAVGHRDAGFLVRVLSGLDGEVDAATARAAHARVLAALAPTTLGRSLNFVYGTVTDARTGYDPGDHERLAALKTVHDPANVFRFNQNITPATSA